MSNYPNCEHPQISTSTKPAQLYLPQIISHSTIQITPNPAEEIINLETDDDNTDIEQINIFDITGRIVLTHFTLSMPIDISTLEPGTYTLLAINKSGLNIGKFVKI